MTPKGICSSLLPLHARCHHILSSHLFFLPFSFCQVYSIEGMDLCLAGTAEILVGGMHMNRILSAAQLPLKLVAFSHCFRTEAGAAGAATRSV